MCDNLDTHKIASLYEAFPPDEALRLAKRLEIHHTPKHGSWFDIAEIELSALGNQCLSKRCISNVEELNEELQLGTPSIMPHRKVSIGSSRPLMHESN